MARQTVPTYDGYIRVSRVGGRSGDSYRSPSDQRAVIERLAAAHGLKLGEIITEEDVSGGKKIAQRELGRLVEKIESGKSSGLIVWKVSRFSRSLLDGVTTASRISEAGGRLLGEDLDTAAPMGKALLGLMLGLAEEELDARREGWKRAVDGAIKRGVYVGRTPVGYSKDKATQLLRQNADAPVVRQAFLSRATGRSWNNLAADFEAAGVKTATGKTDWNINSVRTMISNPVYKGTLVNGIEHHFPALAIVTASEWQAAQPSKGQGNHDHAERGTWALLGGMVTCESCGRPLTPGATQNGGRTYRYMRCQNRTCTARARAHADKLEALVSETALEVLKLASVSMVTTGNDLDIEAIAGLEQAVEDAKERRRQVALVLDVNDPKDAETLTQLSVEVEAAKAALTDALGSQARRVTPDEWVEGWPVWTLDERRSVLRDLGVRVTVAPGRKVPESATVELSLVLQDGAETISITPGGAS